MRGYYIAATGPITFTGAEIEAMWREWRMSRKGAARRATRWRAIVRAERRMMRLREAYYLAQRTRPWR